MRTIQDLESILDSFSGGLVAALLLLQTKDRRPGHREARGAWLETLWREIDCEEIVECRCLWDEMYLFSELLERSAMEERLVSVLKKHTHTHLDSYLLVADVGEEQASVIQSLESMQLQLHKIYYWQEHIFDYYYLNGLKQPLVGPTEQD